MEKEKRDEEEICLIKMLLEESLTGWRDEMMDNFFQTLQLLPTIAVSSTSRRNFGVKAPFKV